MRLRALSALLGLLIGVAPGLRAQVEPQLETKTDLLDVYRKDAGKPEMVVIYDFTTPSRGVFEAQWYLTGRTRAAWIGGNQGQSNSYESTFFNGDKGNASNFGRDFGMAFGMRANSFAASPADSFFTPDQLRGAYPGIFALIGGTAGTPSLLPAAYLTIPKIRMWYWPGTKAIFQQGGSDVVGVPLAYDSATKRMLPVAWVAGDTTRTVISRITHVRFKVAGNRVTRTIDLPCPSRIFDNPAPESATLPRTAQYPTVVKNYQKHSTGSGSDTVVYDPWSDANLINTATPTLSQGNGANAVTDTILGNFFYSFDYLAFIYGGKSVRNASSSDWVAPTAANDPYAEKTTLYAVPEATATVNTALSNMPLSGTTNCEGWNNGLPVMTRYQAMKYVSVNVLLDKDGAINWIYRFLAPAYPDPYTSDDGDSPEELGGVATPPANDGSRNGTKLRYLRRLLSADLKLSATSLQNLGPSNFIATTPGKTMNLSDNGSFLSVDPRTPQPWSYTLANTYYRLSVERSSLTGSTSSATSVFDEQNTSCPGKTFVVPFPCVMMNDSQTTALDQAAAANGVTYARTGSSGLNDGSYTSNAPVASLVPGNDRFFPGDLASTAAFRKSVTALDTFGPNTGIWGTPWNIGSAPHQAKIQTMVVSAAIPGAYKFKSDNNGWNPHEWYFHVAAWADPYRTDMGYGKWVKSQGGTNDESVTVPGGKVRYYASADPAELENNFRDLANYIVAARATLSAPATPSTGARTTTQAYFGIFKTQRKPVWSGNLFAVGIARTEVTDASGVTRETFTFYGANGEDTRPIVDATTTPITYGISDFDNHHLWSAYDVFGKYNVAQIPFDRPVYANGILGSPLLWSQRKVYTIDPLGTANALVDFSAGNATLTSHLQTYLGASATEVADFINFIRGRNPADSGATNRIDTMGDIINSAPLAVELSKDRISGAMLTQWSAFEGSPTTWEDLHARMLLVGTNMGQFHCFGEVAATGKADTTNAATGAVISRKGKVAAYATELWSFIPQDVLKKLYSIYVNRDIEDTYKHAYLVDGDPVLYHKDRPSGSLLRGDTRVSAGEDAVVVFGERKGGRSYWALAISSAGTKNLGASPTNPVVAWSVQPLGSTDAVIKTMGMSSSVPTFASVKNGAADSSGTPAVFLGGGYANNEINARYRALGTITATQGMGQLILALNPVDGSQLKVWDFKDDSETGSIGGGVTPVQMFLGDEQSQRLYWADYKGNIRAIGTNNNTGAATGFRLDYSDITTWDSLRYLRRASKNGTVAQQRFTNKPDAFKLSTGFPVYITEASGAIVRPVTVMVSVGAGDRNNPTDADESMSIGGFSAPAAPPATNRLYVLADRQDSGAQGFDDDGLLDSSLQAIDDNTSGGTTWATSYSDARLSPADSSYLWKNHNGYYFSLLDGSLSSAYGGVTRDKLLVSPLAKEGLLFFSLFNINGNTGFDCSSNQFTRTFRQCDILRPLAIPTQVEASTTVGNTDDANRGEDSCNGLAFYFNSLSSQLTDAGDRVVQGGAVSSKQDAFNAQTGENTPDIKAVKDTSKKPGFRLRTWRIVR